MTRIRRGSGGQGRPTPRGVLAGFALGFLAGSGFLACSALVPGADGELPWRVYSDDPAIAAAARPGGVVEIVESPGGRAFATAINFATARKAGATLRFTVVCNSACTLALSDVFADAVCWSPSARFGFHATALAFGRDPGPDALFRLAAWYPPALLALLHDERGMAADPADWTVGNLVTVEGHELHRALGRGACPPRPLPEEASR
ncbi:MAG: hypothetical protein AB7H93_23475 [Vicinamibacterales bacterium]